MEENNSLDYREIVEKIDLLKSQLQYSDYKVIKYYEAAIQGITSDYDMHPVYAQRQAIRDEINELETLLNETAI